MRSHHPYLLLLALLFGCDAGDGSQGEPVDGAADGMRDAGDAPDLGETDGAVRDGAPDGCAAGEPMAGDGWFSINASESVFVEAPGVVVHRNPTLLEIDVEADHRPVRVSLSASPSRVPDLAVGDPVHVGLWSETDVRRSDIAIAIRESAGGRLIAAAYTGPSGPLRSGVLEGDAFLGIPVRTTAVCSRVWGGPCVSDGIETRLALTFETRDGSATGASGEAIELMFGGARYRAHVELARAVDGTPGGCSHFPMGEWLQFFILPR